MERINKWLARLKIAHKLILSSIVFALPIAVLLYYVTTQYDREIHTCQREIEGTALLEVCRGLQRDLREIESRTSLATAAAVGSPDGLAETRKRVDDALAGARDDVAVQETKPAGLGHDGHEIGLPVEMKIGDRNTAS